MFKTKKKEVKAEEDEEFVEDETEEDVEEDIEDEVEEEKADVKTRAVWVIEDIATQTQQVIYNSKTKKAYDLTSAVVEILNRLED